MVKTRACIRYVASGEERIYDDTWNKEWGDAGVWQWNWLENNYGCDCNRQLFFDRTPPGTRGGNDLDDVECSEGRYRVVWLEFDGERLEGDADSAAPEQK